MAPALRRCPIPTVIDLFAGCGGLSLGLEESGFQTVFVNELNPDAMRTYLYNRRGTGLEDPRNHAYDVMALTQNEGELPALASRLRREHGDVSLVVGGPPCQGYSGIGHRRSFVLHKEEIPSNHLYRDMARVVQEVGPKAFVFENVRGLLNSRWTREGEKGEIWGDVQEAFRTIRVKRGRKLLDYTIEPALIYAKEYGVPQNRPRVLMVGVRSDIDVTLDDSLVARGLLPQPVGGAPDLSDLLGDLVDRDWRPGGETTRYPRRAATETQEEMRVTAAGKIARKGDPVTDHEYSNHSPAIMSKFQYMIDHEGQIPAEMQTKKFAQRVFPEHWSASGPTLTATSLPDDYVHFAQPRTPTVREWARLQTFPDRYVFTGKRTTGGRRRAGDPSINEWSRDVPKFTQIGNAVPVRLARAVGDHLREIIGE